MGNTSTKIKHILLGLLRGSNNPISGILDVEELSFLRSVPPNLHLGRSTPHRTHKFANQRAYHMTVFCEAVTRAVDSGQNHARGAQSMFARIGTLPDNLCFLGESVGEKIILRLGAEEFTFRMGLTMGWIHTVGQYACHLSSGEKSPPGFEHIDIDQHVHVELRRLVMHRPIPGFIERSKVDDMVTVESPPCLFKPAKGFLLARQI